MPVYVYACDEGFEIEQEFAMGAAPPLLTVDGVRYHRRFTPFHTLAPAYRERKAQDAEILKQVDETPSRMSPEGKTRAQMIRDGDLISLKEAGVT
jgi:hypothetical protein